MDRMVRVQSDDGRGRAWRGERGGHWSLPVVRHRGLGFLARFLIND